jgi:hypothetical protein
MTETKAPQSRREVWLQIALAVARDGLPEPLTLDFIEPAHARDSRIVSIRLDRHADSARWAAHLGLGEPRMRQAGTDDGSTVADYGLPSVASLPGCILNLHSTERVDEPVASDLAAQVVAAILAPDALPDGAA